jgi:hypothetical protein
MRAKRDGGSIEWIVMRNRLSNIDAKNKRFMTQATGELARRIGFRVAPGFSERVIFREMFLQGLTVLDIMEMNGGVGLSLSHVAARQEVRDLLKTLRIAKLDEHINKQNEEAEAKEEAKKNAAKEEAKETVTVAEAPKEAVNANSASAAEASKAPEPVRELEALAS